MLELLFLLLPVAAVYGWYMGYRSANKSKDEVRNKLSRDYVTGVDFLLSNQPDKAVDLFLDILQKQEQENEIESSSQFEAELTLGNLFRSRGEVDRALRIHQNLNKNPNYSFEQKLIAKQQLAKDFMVIGFYDRAENLYISLVDEPDFAENALQQLTLIYEKTKEWQKAINVAEKLAHIVPIENNIPLSHYYCEYAISLDNTKEKEIVSLLEKALQVSHSCIRASILLAENQMINLEYQTAISTLQNVLQQNPTYIGEVLPALKYCYQEIKHFNDFELFLIKVSQSYINSNVDLALVDLTEENEGLLAAQAKLYQQLNKNPSTLLFSRFIAYQVKLADTERSKESFLLLQRIVDEYISREFGYRCHYCGYQSHKLTWYCPSCRQWEGVEPISSL